MIRSKRLSGFCVGYPKFLRLVSRLKHREPPNVIDCSMRSLLIDDMTILILRIYDAPFFFAPFALYLLDRLISKLGTRMEGKSIAFSVIKNDVVIRRKMINVALEFVVVPPNNLIQKVVLTENFIEDDLRIVPHVPIQMDVNASRLR